MLKETKPRKITVPFSLIPSPLLLRLAKFFRTVGESLASALPFLGKDLARARISLPKREWAAAALLSAVLNAAMIAVVFIVLAVGLRDWSLVSHAVLLCPAVALISFTTIIYYPRIQARRRMRKLETQLIPATRHLLIELKSGVPLFNAMAGVSDDYGEVSEEFKKIVKKIDGGMSEVDALYEAARENPSTSFRKVLWQISNALKVGSDVSTALASITHEISREQTTRIKRYGQELSPLAMMYMMGCVVLPSLGVTFGIVIGSFMNIAIPNTILFIGIIYLLLFQLFFLNLVGSRRPTV